MATLLLAKRKKSLTRIVSVAQGAGRYSVHCSALVLAEAVEPWLAPWPQKVRTRLSPFGMPVAQAPATRRTWPCRKPNGVCSVKSRLALPAVR